MGVFEPQNLVKRIDLAEEPGFNLGGMRVDPGSLTVSINGQRRDLQPRVMQVLIALARARPAVVSRDRLAELCWDGRVVGDDALNRCVLALRHLAQEFAPEPFAIETVPRVGHRLVEAAAKEDADRNAPSRTKQKIILVAALLALFVAAAMAILRSWSVDARLPTIMVTAAATDDRSQALARNLAASLAGFHAARSARMRLIDRAGESSADPDLILEAARISDSATVGMIVALKSGADGSLIWSDEFKQPSGKLADLSQQVTFTAARVLGCASEGLAERLSQQTLKTYLNACAALADLAGRQAVSVIPMFEEVLKDAPAFEDGWEKLLIADINVAEHTGHSDDRHRLIRHVAAAKTVNSELAAVYESEIVLLPVNAYAQRMSLADRAVALHPTNARTYAIRAQLSQSAGRMKDGVVDARRAMQLEPLSPFARSNYVGALALAGLYDASRHELREAERLWPGSNTVSEMEFAFNLRYGDPKQAWDYLRTEPSADWMNARSYLEARLDRTPAKIQRAFADAHDLYRSRPRAIAHLIQVYGEFDREKELVELLIKAPEPDTQLVDLTFRAPVADFWKHPRSLIVARRVGLLRYWRTSGKWPDFCQAPDLPYNCRTEAAKLDSG